MSINDLQPKPFKIKIKDNEFNCKPIRMSHRLIMAKITPLFKAMEDVANGKEVELSSKQMIELEKELDVLIGDLIPQLSNITLEIEDIASVFEQIMDSTLPEDVKEMKDAKVQTNPKAPSQEVKK